MVIRVFDKLGLQILVSRQSARMLQTEMIQQLHDSNEASTPITLDFAGVAGVSPSFVDELCVIVDEAMRDGQQGSVPTIRFLNPPTRLSSKFHAVGRGHGLSISVLADGAWELVRSEMQDRNRRAS